MSNNHFLDRIHAQIKSKRPFVLYSDFDENTIHAQLQTDEKTYMTSSYHEQGFVFAPFDLKIPTYLIPASVSEVFITDSVPVSATSLRPSVSVSNSTLHKNLVSRAIEAINTSDLEKVVLARTASLTFPKMDILKLFFSLAAVYPKAYTYCWYHPKTGYWLGASPETLLQVEGVKFKTMALAGTQVYKDSMDVQWDIKNHEEQQFVTAYLKKRLAQHSKDLEISAPKTIRAGKLLHLQTTISGTLNSTQNILKSLISSIHPTPAVCGTPKELATTFIKNYEPINRDYYSGFLGQINRSYDNSLKTNLVVNLRCMHLDGHNATLFAGGGITSKSDPDKEWEETESKLRTITSIFSAK